jgi:hypothetical protein
MITTGISLADWSVGSRLQTDLLTLDSRSGDPKFDNGPPSATGLWDRQSDTVVRRRTHVLEYKQPKGLVGILRGSGEIAAFRSLETRRMIEKAVLTAYKKVVAQATEKPTQNGKRLVQ